MAEPCTSYIVCYLALQSNDIDRGEIKSCVRTAYRAAWFERYQETDDKIYVLNENDCVKFIREK